MSEDFDFEAELQSIISSINPITICGELHQWQYRIVWREGNQWHTTEATDGYRPAMTYFHERLQEMIIQRRRRRDHLDPTPCEGIEDPVWRDWVASDDPDIQGVLISKGMPFRSLEK